MDIDERTYQYRGIVTIKRSRLLKDDALPKDDLLPLPWLFLAMDERGERRYTFLYKIEQPSNALYGIPFIIQLAFIMDGMEKIIELNQTYDVWRGEECIGEIKIIEEL